MFRRRDERLRFAMPRTLGPSHVHRESSDTCRHEVSHLPLTYHPPIVQPLTLASAGVRGCSAFPGAASAGGVSLGMLPKTRAPPPLLEQQTGAGNIQY